MKNLRKRYTNGNKDNLNSLVLSGHSVTLFGSSRHLLDPIPETVRGVVRQYHEAGYGYASFGAGHTGIMGVMSGEALALGMHVLGVTLEHFMGREGALEGIKLLLIGTDEKKKTDHALFERMQIMISRPNGFVDDVAFFPGGWGTLQELGFTLTHHLQCLNVDEASKQKLVVYNIANYYGALVGLVRYMNEQGFNPHEDLPLYLSKGEGGKITHGKPKDSSMFQPILRDVCSPSKLSEANELRRASRQRIIQEAARNGYQVDELVGGSASGALYLRRSGGSGSFHSVPVGRQMDTSEWMALCNRHADYTEAAHVIVLYPGLLPEMLHEYGRVFLLQQQKLIQSPIVFYDPTPGQALSNHLQRTTKQMHRFGAIGEEDGKMIVVKNLSELRHVLSAQPKPAHLRHIQQTAAANPGSFRGLNPVTTG